jgi:hypothetical protein
MEADTGAMEADTGAMEAYSGAWRLTLDREGSFWSHGGSL